jgi:hypothetical protein
MVARPGGGVRLKVHVQPGASRTEVAGRHGDAIKVRLAAPPVDGRANEALLHFLAERLGLPLRAVTLVRGVSSRAKTVDIEGMDPDEVSRVLLAP